MDARRAKTTIQQRQRTHFLPWAREEQRISLWRRDAIEQCRRTRVRGLATSSRPTNVDPPPIQAMQASCFWLSLALLRPQGPSALCFSLLLLLSSRPSSHCMLVLNQVQRHSRETFWCMGVADLARIFTTLSLAAGAFISQNGSCRILGSLHSRYKRPPSSPSSCGKLMHRALGTDRGARRPASNASRRQNKAS